MSRRRISTYICGLSREYISVITDQWLFQSDNYPVGLFSSLCHVLSSLQLFVSASTFFEFVASVGSVECRGFRKGNYLTSISTKEETVSSKVAPTEQKLNVILKEQNCSTNKLKEVFMTKVKVDLRLLKVTLG